jgi:hypothetical protein
MALPSKQAALPSQDPEVHAYTLVHVGPAMWARREYLIKGDKVLAFTDAEPDSKAPTLGRIIRLLERTE